MPIFFVDDKYIDSSEASIPLTDLAVLRGYGVFDYLRTYNGRPFHLSDHLQRLHNSASLLHLNTPWSLQELEAIVMETLRKNDFDEASIRLLITGGDSSDSITPLDQPRLVVMVTPLVVFPEHWYSNGVKAITAGVTRYVPEAKSTNYIKAIVALKGARQRGAVESLYKGPDGEIFEGTTSNIFVVHQGRLLTPAEKILPGITRQVVMSLAEKKFVIEKRSLFYHELANCSEAFLTSSNKEVLPLIQIDDIVISQTPGGITQEVMKMFGDYIAAW